MAAVTTSNLRSRRVSSAGAAAPGPRAPVRRAASDSGPAAPASRTASGPALVVTGMHRSGTSLAASILRTSGVDMGERLMAPQASNPAGFFEDLDFVELHMDALERRGLHPDGWDARPLASLGRALSARARDLARRKSAGGP